MAGLLKVPFFPDETLLSFASRMARANGLSRLRCFLEGIGLDPVLVGRGDEGEIEKLAMVFNMPTKDLLIRRLVVNADDSVEFAEARFSRFFLWRSKLRVCVQCLAEDELDVKRMPGTRRYGRTIWMLPSVGTCFHHRCALVRYDVHNSWKCPDFYEMLDAVGPQIAADCRFPSYQTPTDFETFVVERVNGLREHGPLLDAVSLSTAIDLCQLFGMASQFGHNFRFYGVEEQGRRHAANQGYLALLTALNGVHGVLNRLAATSKLDNSRGGQALYGALYRALHRAERGPEYDLMRAIIRDHMIDRSLVPPDGDDFDGLARERGVSLRRLTKKTGAPLGTVRQFLAGHCASLQSSGPKASQFVNIELAKRTIGELSNTVGLPEASALLGWTVNECRRLADYGILSRVASPAVKRQGIRARFNWAALIELKGRLLARASPDSENLQPLRKVLPRFRDRYAEVLRAIFNGRIQYIAYSERSSLLDSLKVDMSEVRAIIGSERK